MSMIGRRVLRSYTEKHIGMCRDKYGGYDMKCNSKTETGLRAKLRGATALVLALCLFFSAMPTALGASSMGTSAAAVTPTANNKTYIKLMSSVLFFTGDLYAQGSTVTPGVGTVWQLVNENYYTGSDGQNYYGVYYQNARYNVLCSDVDASIMSAADLITYFTTVLWVQPQYVTLNEASGLVGDVRVHGLQYALSLLGYYSGKLDGNYGAQTTAAVRKFQKAKSLYADGEAGTLTQPAIYALASGTSSGSSSSGGGTVATTGTIKTTVSVNLRKSTSTKSARLAVVPAKTTLAYTNVTTNGGVSWYKVTYNSLTGWLMGTYVTGGSSSSASSSAAAIGSVTITMPGTRVRKTANGAKTGTTLAKGTVVDLIAPAVSAGGYTWYNIRTSAGLVGFVRGDCSTATMGGSGGVTPSTAKTFVMLPAATELFTTEAKPTSGLTTVAASTVLQMVSTTTYTSGGVVYCSLYYNNEKYNAVYADVQAGILNSTQLAAYVTSLWNTQFSTALKQSFNLVGDVRVYAMQLALYVLGYYTAALDGNFGGGSTSAVRNFQRKNNLTVDGSCGPQTWEKLSAQAKAASDGSASGSGAGSGSGSGSGSGTGVVTTDFGTVNSVEKASWETVDNGSVSLFKKGTTATVLDIVTGKVFTIYRWSGGYHADCVPYTENDTKVMCDIVGSGYSSAHPNSSQLALIKADSNSTNNSATYTWPDFNNAFNAGFKDIGSAWDRRAALLNVGGRVFCVSIYGYPHGFNGTDSFATASFPNGKLFYVQNNFYGMMCIHFVNSHTHGGGVVDSAHQTNIDKAYTYAKGRWPTLCK